MVDLPAPLGPRNPKISPRPTVKSMPRTRWLVRLRIGEGESADADHLGANVGREAVGVRLPQRSGMTGTDTSSDQTSRSAVIQHTY